MSNYLSGNKNMPNIKKKSSNIREAIRKKYNSVIFILFLFFVSGQVYADNNVDDPCPESASNQTSQSLIKSDNLSLRGDFVMLDDPVKFGFFLPDIFS